MNNSKILLMNLVYLKGINLCKNIFKIFFVSSRELIFAKDSYKTNQGLDYIFKMLHFSGVQFRDIYLVKVMPSVNSVIYGCSSSITTPRVITIQGLHTGLKTLSQLLLEIG